MMALAEIMERPGFSQKRFLSNIRSTHDTVQLNLNNAHAFL